MATDIGEYLVGAYLKLEEHCDVVDYNVRLPGGGINGLGELDVVGYDMAKRKAYLCEVTTHIRGLLIGGSQAKTIEKIREKYERQVYFAANRLNGFECRFQFWSPYVPKGFLTGELAKIEGLDLIINGEYTKRVELLKMRAGNEKQETGNIFFRTLQILQSLRTEDAN